MSKNYKLKTPTIDNFSNEKIYVLWTILDTEGTPRYFDVTIDKTMKITDIMDIILDQSVSYIISEEYGMLVSGIEKYKNEWLGKTVLDTFLLTNKKVLDIFQKMIEDTLK